jgi:predicted nucleic acid-binding protein
VKRVIPDSNVLIGDFHRQSGPVRLLLEESQRDEIELVVPEIVIVEVLEKFRDELAEAHREYGRWQKKLNQRMQLALEAAPHLDIDARLVAYDTELRRAIEDAGGRIEGFPAAGPARSVRRDIRGARPFAEGRGWRDALIWETALEELADDDVVFVTADNDFRSDDALHPDLAAEAAEVDGGELRLYRSLRAYIDAEVAAALAAAEQARQLLLHNGGFRASLETQISEEVLGAQESQFDGLDFFATRVDLIDIEVVTAWPETIEILTGQELEGGTFNLDLTAVVEAEFDVYLFKYDAWSLEGDALDRIVDFDHNESVARANFSMRVEASMSATFSPEEPAVNGVWLDAMTEA